MRTKIALSIAALLLTAYLLPVNSPASVTASSQLEVHYLANEGFLIAGGGKRVLIDALFRQGVSGYAKPSAELREKTERARAPFDGVDLVLATHFHADHFDPLAVVSHLAHNREALFVSTGQAVEKMKASEGIEASVIDRVRGLRPGEGERIRIAHRGVNLQVLNIHHGRNRPIENLGFIVEIGGKKILHIGDSEASAVDFQVYNLAADRIDIAFLPYWYFLSDGFKRAVREAIKPARIVLMHIPPSSERDADLERRGGREKVFAAILSEFPQAVFFEREMERKTFD